MPHLYDTIIDTIVKNCNPNSSFITHGGRGTVEEYDRVSINERRAASVYIIQVSGELVRVNSTLLTALRSFQVRCQYKELLQFYGYYLQLA